MSIIVSEFDNFIKFKPGFDAECKLILSKGSWGSKQAKSELNITLPKTNMNSVDVLKLVVRRYVSREFEYIPEALDELSNSCNEFETVVSSSTVQNKLKEVWNKYCKLFDTREEKLAFKYIIVRIGLEVEESKSIGRRQYEKMLFTYASHICFQNFEI